MDRLWFTVQPLLALAAATPLLAQGFAFETKQQDPSRYRPPGLKILSQRAVPYGEEVLGVYAIRDAEDIEEGKRVKVWHEKGADLKVRNETIRCDTTNPMRITSTGSRPIAVRLRRRHAGAMESASIMIASSSHTGAVGHRTTMR